jgi:16S rRNA processing protein RimM
VVLGEVSGVYGVRGWLRVRSHTDPVEQILRYGPWQLERSGHRSTHRLEGGRLHGRGVLAKFAGIDDRDQARELVGARISVARAELPELEPGDYYWNDLIGLRVVTRRGDDLGRVTGLMATGANDVLVVEGDSERLIPFIDEDVVLAVDLDAGRIQVDWDPEF